MKPLVAMTLLLVLWVPATPVSATVPVVDYVDIPNDIQTSIENVLQTLYMIEELWILYENLDAFEANLEREDLLDLLAEAVEYNAYGQGVPLPDPGVLQTFLEYFPGQMEMTGEFDMAFWVKWWADSLRDTTAGAVASAERNLSDQQTALEFLSELAALAGGLSGETKHLQTIQMYSGAGVNETAKSNHLLATLVQLISTDISHANSVNNFTEDNLRRLMTGERMGEDHFGYSPPHTEEAIFPWDL